MFVESAEKAGFPQSLNQCNCEAFWSHWDKDQALRDSTKNTLICIALALGYIKIFLTKWLKREKIGSCTSIRTTPDSSALLLAAKAAAGDEFWCVPITAEHATPTPEAQPVRHLRSVPGWENEERLHSSFSTTESKVPPLLLYLPAVKGYLYMGIFLGQ